MLERNKNLGKVKVDPQLTSSPPQVVLGGAGGAVVDMNLGCKCSQTRLFFHLFCIGCNQARALRALGLLLADGTPTVGGGKTF